MSDDDQQLPSVLGRSRGRSRGVLPGQEQERPEVPIGSVPRVVESMEEMGLEERDEEMESPPREPQFEGMYSSDEERGGRGSGSGSTSSNGHGNNGNGRGSHRSSPPGNGDGNGNGNGNGSGSGSDHGNGNGEGEVAERGPREAEEPITTRPVGLNKSGTAGAGKSLYANYFELQTKKGMALRLYVARFEPEEDNVPKRRALLRTREGGDAAVGVGPYLFDGAQLITSRPLPEDLLTLTDVHFPDSPENVYTIRIQFIREISHLENFAIQFYNLIVKKCQALLGLTRLGRFFYDHEKKITIPHHRLELWPGYLTSMRQQEREILLNVDSTFKVVRTDCVFDLMKQLRSQDGSNYQRACEEALVGTIVMTVFNRKTYKVDGIDWNQKATDTFKWDRKVGGVPKSDQISFVDYYMQKHNTRITVGGQPLLISIPREQDNRRGDTGNILLLPELCFITGLSEAMRANYSLMKDLSNQLHMPPTDRLRTIRQFVKRITDSQEVTAEMLRWGCRFKPDPITVPGRLMPSEKIIFQTGSVEPNDKADWSLPFRNHKMLTSARCAKWAIVVSSRDAEGVGNLIQTMQRVANPLGYRIEQPETLRVTDQSARAFTTGIQGLMEKHGSQLDMIFVVLPSPKLETYAAVKQICSLKYGVPSQCFLAANFRKKQGLMSICTKLVIQMNAKQGGRPWSVPNPLHNLMVVGFDVHHAKGTSYGAMTASLEPTLGTYFSTILRNENKMEISSGMGGAFQKCLKAYVRYNGGKLPARIMFYRDGVGEGQLNFVIRSELPAIEKVINSAYQHIHKAELAAGEEPPAPKLTLVVVTKRINARLFEGDPRAGFDNPKPGTVVDDRITCPERFDFYLIPQCARQGTVSPVLFNVVKDESGLGANKIQLFTFKLCHLYFNWSGTVTVPAPCQYAHKLAFLTGTALLGEARETLSNQLHFL